MLNSEKNGTVNNNEKNYILNKEYTSLFKLVIVNMKKNKIYFNFTRFPEATETVLQSTWTAGWQPLI